VDVRFAALVASVLSLAAAAPASAAPDLLSVVLRDPAVAGSTALIEVRATDPKSATTGVRVVFTDGEEAVGTSACRYLGPRPKAFRPGSTGVFRFPHVFSQAGTSGVLVRVDSSGCGVPQEGTLQAFAVETVARGLAPKPLIPLTSELPVLPGLVADIVSLSPIRATAAAVPCRGADTVPTADPASLAQARRALLCLINDERVARGVPVIHTHKRLSRAARLHSRAMVLQGFFAHVAPSGRPDLLARLEATRYVRSEPEALAENIGAGTGSLATPASIVEGWMESPPHRANLLDAAFKEIGLGVYPGMAGGSPSGATYTLDFATR
jgi:uncharacterized protein YkwD